MPGLTKSYQVNPLFTRQTLRDNIVIAALVARPGTFSLDLLRRIDRVPGLDTQVEATLARIGLTARADVPVAELAYGEKRRLEIGLALASSPSLLLLDEPLRVTNLDGRSWHKADIGRDARCLLSGAKQTMI